MKLAFHLLLMGFAATIIREFTKGSYEEQRRKEQQERQDCGS